MNKKQNLNLIAQNKKAKFNYFIEEDFEAGLVLEGWEVKSLRAGKVNISDAHVIIKNNEALLLGADIQPLSTVSTHISPDSHRSRKLLLHRRQINRLIGAIERQGYTVVPLSLYWKNNLAKIKIALAKGKKQHDKRSTIKDRDWQRERARFMKRGN